MIRITVLHYIPKTEKYWKIKTFYQYAAENGNSLYLIGSEYTDKETGNQTFKDLVANAREYSVSRNTLELSDKETLEHLGKSIDPYVEYIDNYRQYKEAQASNQHIYNLMDAFRKTAASGLST